MPENNLTYRLAEKSDVQIYYEWANDETVRSTSFSPQPIEYNDHEKWFQKKIDSDESIMLIFYYGSAAIGQVRIDRTIRDMAEIDYSIDSHWRRKKLGASILKLSKMLLQKIWPTTILKGIVKSNNVPSIKAFESAGFLKKEKILVHNIDCFIFYSK